MHIFLPPLGDASLAASPRLVPTEIVELNVVTSSDSRYEFSCRRAERSDGIVGAGAGSGVGVDPFLFMVGR